MPLTLPKRGLYAITQTAGKTEIDIITEVTAAIRGGAVMVQYRDKHPTNARQLAQQLIAACHAQDVPLIINDDLELALETGADGVHLGKDDGAVATARKLLGDNAIIGASCYNSVESAVKAQAEGASYAAFGRFFASGSKPLATPASPATLKEAKLILHIPIVAIGGILPENGGRLLAAGADMLAVIGGLFDYQPEPAARAFSGLFDYER